MKRLLLVFALLIAYNFGFSQIPEEIKRHYTNSIDVYTIIPFDKHEDFGSRPINPGVTLSASYVIPFGKSNFAFSIGGGFAFHNYYLKSFPKDMIPVELRKESWGDDFYFKPIDTIMNPTIKYSKNKMVLSYFDVPLELRYCANNGFKVSAGFKVSFLIGSRHKFKGSDYLFGTDENIKIKKYKLNNLSNFNLGPVLRIGWKWFNAYASYSLVSVYDASGGSKLKPFSVGLSFTPDRW